MQVQVIRLNNPPIEELQKRLDEEHHKPRPQPTFGYSHPLKTAFKKGLLPTVKKGIYGIEINNKNVSLEHGDAFSKGGKTELSNLFLADKYMNSKRGNKPIELFITNKMLKEYLKQFADIVNKYIDGNEYARSIWKRFSGRLP